MNINTNILRHFNILHNVEQWVKMLKVTRKKYNRITHFQHTDKYTCSATQNWYLEVQNYHYTTTWEELSDTFFQMLQSKPMMRLVKSKY